MADWASLGIGAGGGLIGSILGYFGQKDANDTNREIAAQTNAQNYKIWQEQQQHNIDMFNMQNQAQIDMWNMQNEYNTASAQRQRLEEAGLNPYLMMNGGSAGVASSMNAGTAQPAQAPTMQPGAPVESALGAGVQGYAQMMNSLSQAYAVANASEEHNARLPGIEWDNKTKELGFKTSLDYKNNILPLVKRQQGVATDIAEATADAQIELTNNMLETQRLENTLKGMDIEAKGILNDYLDQNQQIDLARKIQGLVNDVLHGELLEKDIKKKIAETCEVYSKVAYNNIQTKLGKQEYAFNEENNQNLLRISEADAQLKELGVVFQKEILPSMIDSAIAENEASIVASEKERKQNEWNDNWFNRGTGVVGDFFRQLLSGWLPFSAGYNVNQNVGGKKPTRPIGFIP